MVRLTLDLTGKDATFISNCYRYYSGLSTLGLYRNHPDQLPNLEKIKEEIDILQHAFEGGATGNRVEIEMRKRARKAVTEMFKKIASYLQSVATEDDIPALLQAGFDVRRLGLRKKAAHAEPSPS